MPTSRFLKKKRTARIKDVASRSSLSHSFLEEKLSRTNVETRDAIGKERPKNDSNQRPWKLKDEDFVHGIKKRLNDLTRFLSPSSSSPSFYTSVSSTSYRSYSSATTPRPHQPFRDVLPLELIAREPYVPVVNLERPKILLDKWKAGSSRNDGVVRSFLLDRACSRAAYPEDDESDLIRSMFQIVQATGTGHGRNLDFHWRPVPSTRQELAEFSSNIGSLAVSSDRDYLIDGRDFWTRLATVKGEYMRTEKLVSRVFDRDQSPEEYVYVSPRRQLAAWSSLPSTPQFHSYGPRGFPAADEAIRWAHYHRLQILDF